MNLFNRTEQLLLIGASISFLLALIQLAVVMIGGYAYSIFWGAQAARIAGAGFITPVIKTLFYALIMCVFGFYGISGAGIIRRLPFLNILLLMIGLFCTLRGFGLFMQISHTFHNPNMHSPIAIVFLAIMLIVVGILYIIGSINRFKQAEEEEEAKDKKTIVEL